jgi:hypothetical protein
MVGKTISTSSSPTSFEMLLQMVLPLDLNLLTAAIWGYSLILSSSSSLNFSIQLAVLKCGWPDRYTPTKGFNYTKVYYFR